MLFRYGPVLGTPKSVASVHAPEKLHSPSSGVCGLGQVTANQVVLAGLWVGYIVIVALVGPHWLYPGCSKVGLLALFSTLIVAMVCL